MATNKSLKKRNLDQINKMERVVKVSPWVSNYCST